MRVSIRHALLIVALTAGLPIALAAALKNPVKADAKSIAGGKQVYDANCAGCHGETGKGDGQLGEELNPKPANLVDAEWKHGSTDGDIFTVIHNGFKGTGMKAYGRKLTTHQIWDVVNYIRSIGPLPTR